MLVTDVVLKADSLVVELRSIKTCKEQMIGKTEST